MPYNPRPHGFQTKHWRKLYESYILDLETLRASVRGAVFVIIDAEPWGVDSSKPAEIGISLVPSLDRTSTSTSTSTLPTTLDATIHLLQLETHWIRVSGRGRQENNRETHRYGQQHCVEDDQVDKTVSDIIDRFLQKQPLHSNPWDRIPLILTGFGLNFEFRILSSLYPRLLDYFTSWLDLQQVARGVASDAATADGRHVVYSPSLRETLIACGFESDARNAQGLRTQHNAATDSVRAAAVLVHLLGLPHGEELDIRRSSRRENHVKKNRRMPSAPGEMVGNGVRPNPKEFFPYTARVSRTTGFGQLETRALLDLFVYYGPTAVGISKGKRYGWVCLPDLNTPQDPVRNVNGSTGLGDGDVWTAVSDYDPAVVPVKDKEELRLNRRRGMDAQADEKRAQRKLRREAQDAEANI